jgi:membrane fusion protein (multidrug efflux system)
VHLKQTVTLSTQSDDKTDAQSKIDFISPQIDPLNDTVLVRASLPSATWLRSGQFVKGRIVVEELPQRLAVPLISVVQQDGKSVIALVEGDTAKQREVSTGLQDGELIEIQGDGLREGMTVVTQGAYSLPPETRIHIEKQP